MNLETKEYLKHRQQSGGVLETALDEKENICTDALLLDAGSAAELLGFTRQYFYDMHKSGRLGPMPIYFGKRSRWSRYEIENWVRSNCPNRQNWLLMQETEKITA